MFQLTVINEAYSSLYIQMRVKVKLPLVLTNHHAMKTYGGVSV
jgi:hypothetical protein